MLHAHYFLWGSETILGDVANPSEVFVSRECADLPLTHVISVLTMFRTEVKCDWHVSGGCDLKEQPNLYFTRVFDKEECRFVDYVPIPGPQCMSCFWKRNEQYLDEATIEKDRGRYCIEYKKDKYYVGSGVLIDYERNGIPKIRKRKRESDDEDDDDDRTFMMVNGEGRWLTRKELKETFPEKHRSPGSHANFANPCQPLTVGIIDNIKPNGVIRIREFWRPEETKDGKCRDPHLVHWTRHFYPIKNLKHFAALIKGKCYVSHVQYLRNKDQWAREGPNRFFFYKRYNPQNETFLDVPLMAENIGAARKSEPAPPWPKLETKLECMDIYAGCGGISTGLEKSGAVETKWAVEYDEIAAKSFQANHPNATVITGDCNKVIDKLMNKKNHSKLNLPDKGQVDIIVGGPPCQGFSRANQFKGNDSSEKNNCQLSTFLSFVDWYRSTYVLFENVQNFTRYKGGIYFKLLLRCLLEVGYQVTFGILHAGHHGVPQSRRRIFVIAAAPGRKLPTLPKKTHCFGTFEKKTDPIKIDNIIYNISDEPGVWGSLPFRRVTVEDAIGDLPPINYDNMQDEMPYKETRGASSYSRNLREHCPNKNLVTHHVCRKPNDIYQKRIELIPAGGDWTDLPNIGVKFAEPNLFTVPLKYTYRSNKKTGETTRTVKNTPNKESLIPFRLANSQKNSNWKGVYGRVIWNGHFETVLTVPDPTGIQGRVIHPEQNRTFSVREYARAQGFPDNFQFVGSLNDKFHQIGNAVPPILATAIGREFVKAINSSRR